MNEYEHLRRLAEINKKRYPAGTRILLNNMDDYLDPVPSGTRGTVDSVDDIGQIFMKWDNGRTLPLNSDVDSFRSSPMRNLPRNRLRARTWTRTTAPLWECRRSPIGTRYSYTAAAGRYAAPRSRRA